MSMADTKTTAAPGVKMVTFTIDGRSTSVPKGTMVLQAALDMGIHIPSFCWHPKLKPVGACRMCYVEIEKMPKLQVSCATEATEGMVVRTNSDQVRQGRKAVLEFLLTNHPLDCPTCDKGGECDLQNLTFAHGYDDSRFDFFKRRHIPEAGGTTFDDLRIGPEIMLNRNRCILCYKCVRSNKEAFGEYDLGAFERGNHMEINAVPGGQVDNPFSGNLVEICPVGALTNSDWRYKIRVWLTKQAASICNFTSSGTNITFYKEDHRSQIFRTTSRRNDEIDDGWLPDVTRYGYQIVHSPDRLQAPLIKKDGKQVPVTWDEALACVAKHLAEIKSSRGSSCIGGLVGASQDNATLYAFGKYMRTFLGTNNVDFRTEYKSLLPDPQSSCAVLGSQPFTIADIDHSDVIVVFGSDLMREHPNEYLRLRKARNFGSPRIYSVNSFAVKSADVADLEMIYRPGTEEAVISGLCLAAIDEKLAEGGLAAEFQKTIGPAGLDKMTAACGLAADDLRAMVKALASAQKLTFIIGEQVTRSRDRELIASALCNLVRLLDLTKRGQVALLAQQANAVGAELLGLLPTPSPARKKELTSLWGEYPESTAFTTDQMFGQMLKNELDACVIVGANPVMMYPDRQFAAEAMEKLDFLVVCDLFETETTALADVVLPLAAWAEYEGDYINLEGRLQHAQRGIKPKFDARPGYAIMETLAELGGKPLFADHSTRDGEMARLLAIERRLPWPAKFIDVKPGSDQPEAEYPYALIIGDDAHHRGYLTEKSASLANFCSEAYVELSPELASRIGVEAGKPVRVESPAGRIIVTARISENLDANVVFVPRNFSATHVTTLLSRNTRVDRVKLSNAIG
jgi:NADH-quinone oxidoreductase subunit G